VYLSLTMRSQTPSPLMGEERGEGDQGLQRPLTLALPRGERETWARRIAQAAEFLSDRGQTPTRGDLGISITFSLAAYQNS